MTKQEKSKRDSEVSYYTSPNHIISTVKKPLAVGFGAAALLAGLHEYSAQNDNSAHPLKPEAIAKASVNRRVDTSIVDLHLEKGANVRKDSFVPGQEDSPNLVEKLDKSVDVKAKGDVVVEEQTSDGTWYGIPATSLERVLQRDDPDFHVKGDSDGYVWINEQRAEPETSQVADEP